MKSLKNKLKKKKQIFPEQGKNIPWYEPKIFCFSMAVLLIMWAKNPSLYSTVPHTSKLFDDINVQSRFQKP